MPQRMMSASADCVGAPRAERRQVAVMFSDVVGSTALSTRMDPEDLREVISAYQKYVAETVQPFGASSRSTWGVLIYFEAHEDDAERAVRAGLQKGIILFFLPLRVVFPCLERVFRQESRSCRRLPLHSPRAEGPACVRR